MSYESSSGEILSDETDSGTSESIGEESDNEDERFADDYSDSTDQSGFVASDSDEASDARFGQHKTNSEVEDDESFEVGSDSDDDDDDDDDDDSDGSVSEDGVVQPRKNGTGSRARPVRAPPQGSPCAVPCMSCVAYVGLCEAWMLKENDAVQNLFNGAGAFARRVLESRRATEDLNRVLCAQAYCAATKKEAYAKWPVEAFFLQSAARKILDTGEREYKVFRQVGVPTLDGQPLEIKVKVRCDAPLERIWDVIHLPFAAAVAAVDILQSGKRTSFATFVSTGDFAACHAELERRLNA